MNEEECENLNTTEQIDPPKGSARRHAYYDSLLPGGSVKPKFCITIKDISKRISTWRSDELDFDRIPTYRNEFISPISWKFEDSFICKFAKGSDTNMPVTAGHRLTREWLNAVHETYQRKLREVATSISNSKVSIDGFIYSVSTTVVNTWWKKNLRAGDLGFKPIVVQRSRAMSDLLSASMFSKSTLVDVYEFLKDNVDTVRGLGNSLLGQWGIDIAATVRNLILLQSVRTSKFEFCDGLDFLRKSLVKSLFYIYPSEEDELGKFAVCPCSIRL